MTLEELLTKARADKQSQIDARLVAISERKTLTLAKLDRLGISTADGWILQEQPADQEGVLIKHPALPGTTLATVSHGSAPAILYIHVSTIGGVGVSPKDAWDIAEEMGATL